MAHGGSGIGRVDGRVIFCPGVIPGEVALVDIIEDSKKSLWRGQAREILVPSPHRVDHIWPEASIHRPWENRAGGADYGHIELSHQRDIKTDILRDALRRFGKLEGDIVDQVTVAPVPGDDQRNGLGWRSRVTMHVTDTGALGPFAEKTHTVIPVSSVPLASDPITDSGLLSTSYEGATTVRAIDSSGSGIRLIIDTQSPHDITEMVGETAFTLSDHSFWQVHSKAPMVLRGAIQRAVQIDALHPDAHNLDLYSGVGLLGHALAELSDTRINLTAVESDDAINYVVENLESVANITPVSARVDRWLADQVRTQGAEDTKNWSHATVLLDPPRSGAKSDVIHALTTLGVGQIVYVACDPVALGRDTGLLQEAGYDMVFLEAWDLFPHTHHMESIATFRKR